LLHGRGRGRIVNAALALVFATLGIGSVVYDLRVGDVLIDGVGRFSEMQSRPQPKLPALFDRAWTGKDAATRQLVARTLYQLRGVRVAWQDETGAGRLFEPTPEMVRKNEQRLRAEETLRALNILFADHAAYRFRDLCAHFIGVVVMLLGSLVLCARSRAAPGTSPPPPPGPHPIDS
jgi:hypothetical protein